MQIQSMITSMAKKVKIAFESVRTLISMKMIIATKAHKKFAQTRRREEKRLKGSRHNHRELSARTYKNYCAITFVNKSLTKGVKKGENQLLRVSSVCRRKSFINTPPIWSKKLLWNYWHNKSINILLSAGVFYVPFFCCVWNYSQLEAIKTFLLHRHTADGEMKRWEVGLCQERFFFYVELFYDQFTDYCNLISDN